MPYLPKVKELWSKGSKLSKNNFSVQSFYVAFFHIPTQIENIDDINEAPRISIFFFQRLVKFDQKSQVSPLQNVIQNLTHSKQHLVILSQYGHKLRSLSP